MNKPEDRRKYPRLRREERAVLHRADSGDDDPAVNVLYCKTVDISPTGLQVRAKQQLPPGEPVDVVISLEGYGDSFHLRGESRWCRPAEGTDEFLLGVELLPVEGSDLALWRRIFN
ncbi:MAG: PilZ domain-containing protein [Gammaproteobacteria bacterium]|nr:PilZ domain-containing protein [Gammaproteobacteria bacterium]MDE2108553.1 PilZ domain-containing protein [Gammaproteobacteria bacterium]MDE2461981.1 PilZ domain-containing protein [Gammaproteobacteria bacterium]